jgi:hypothetical protein
MASTYVDSFSLKGHSHDRCEDNSGHNSSGIAGVADGCSAVYSADGKRIKNARTDLGSAAVAAHFTSGATIVPYMCDKAEYYQPMNAVVLHRLRSLVNFAVHAGVKHARYTTVGSVELYGNNKIAAVMAGDGAILYCEKGSNKFMGERIGFEARPRYPVHDGSSELPYAVDIDVDLNASARQKEQYPVIRYFDIDKVSAVAVVTDGLFSFRTAKYEPFDALPVFRDIKGLRGEWCVRHLKGVCRELAAQGIVHEDDISIAGISIIE